MSGGVDHVLGNVSFAPAHPLPSHIADEVMNQMGDSIVALLDEIERVNHELEESEARVAVLEAEQAIMARERAEAQAAAKNWERLAKRYKNLCEAHNAAVTEGSLDISGDSDLSRRTISFLRNFNRWRRGDDSIEQPQPGAASRAIDDACDLLERLERERDEARQAFAMATDRLVEAQSNERAWRECADKLAASLGLEAADTDSGCRRVGTTDALAEFERRKEASK